VKREGVVKLDSIEQNNDLIVWEEVKDRNWVIFYGNERYFIDERTKNAIVNGVSRGLPIVVVDGVVWTDKFSRILPIEMVKEAEYLRKGYRKSKKMHGKWYDPNEKPIVYFD